MLAGSNVAMQRKFYSFEDFWKDFCRFKGFIITFLFYLGTICLLVTLGLMVWIKFYYEFHNSAAAWVFGSFLIATLIICLWIARDDLRDDLFGKGEKMCVDGK